MNRTDLLKLLGSSSRTLADVKAKSPDVYALLRTMSLAQARVALTAAFADASPEVVKLVAAVTFDSLDAIAPAVTKAFAGLPADVAANANARLDTLVDGGAFDDPLADGTVTIGDLPLAQDELEQAKVYVVGGLAQIPETSLGTIAAPSIAALDDDALDAQVAAKTLSAAQAGQLGLTSNLYALFDENPALTAAVRTAINPKAVRDLASLDANAWVALLQKDSIDPPAGLDTPAYARALASRVAAVYPTEAFIRRLPAVDSKTLADDIRNKNAAALAKLAGAYPGMDLANVFDDAKISPEEKAQIAARRVSLVTQVLATNQDKELLDLDYSPDSPDLASLGLGSASADEQTQVLRTLKAYQRVHTFTNDIDASHALLAAGVSSATQAGAMTKDEFTTTTGLDDAHYAEARRTLSATTSMATAAMDVVRGSFDQIRVSNVGLDAKEMLRKFDGFADLFGSQDYCKCDECRSILGPAAYFVDLMTFIDDNVRKRFFKGAKADHALALKVRRPDLWHLQLTCDNTNTLVPTLDIANGILENFIAKDAAARAGGTVDVSKHSEVHDWVYEKTLSQRATSFGQPFVLPLERLTLYLGHFKCDRSDIARALGAGKNAITRTTLDLSVFERHAIVNPNPDPTALSKLFDVTFEVQGQVLAPVDVRTFMRATGTSRDEIGRIVATRFVGAGAGKPKIVSSKASKASIQNDIEKIHGLTYDTVDRIHRFTRFWHRWNVAIEELDLVLTELDDKTLDGDTLDNVAAIRHAMDTLRTSVEATCPLFAHIPAHPVAPNGTSLLDRLFDPTGSGATLPDATKTFLHPSLRLDGSSTKTDPSLPQLLAGLRVSDEDLLRLITLLKTPLGVQLDSSTEDGRRFALSAQNLALLYRHARLAERFRLSIDQLSQLLDLTSLGAIRGLDDLSKLLDAHEWWSTSGYSLDDLSVILGKAPSDPTAYPAAADIAAQVIADPSSTLVFADTIFAVALDVTEDTSRAIVQTIAASLEVVTDVGYRLGVAFNPDTPLVLPPALGVNEGDVRNVLRAYHPIAVVPSRLSSALQIATDKVNELIAIANRSLLDPALATALRGAPASPQGLVDLVAAVLPLSVLFENSVFDASAIEFVRQNQVAFGLQLPAATLAGARALSVYSRFAPAPTPVQFTTDAAPISVADLQTALAHFDPTTGFAASVTDELARVLATTKRTMATLKQHTTIVSPAALAFDQLAQCAAMSTRLGVGGEVLDDAVADPGTSNELKDRATEEYGQLASASEAILGAFRAQYADDDKRDAAIEPFDNKLRSRTRDALTDYLIHDYRPAFADMRAIYEYFLIDVELEGCARTSRVVSATNTLQLYFQRCLMDLEEDKQAASNPDHIHVVIDKTAASEWEWRKAYRVWQANRKVFLYPESYLEPDLRDDKTPLFEALEAALLQQQINYQATLDAYTAYVDGFQDVGTLTIAGAYYDDDGDTLHLIGTTSDDPPRHFYRAIERPFSRKKKVDAPSYAAWRSINVQIPARRASPIMHDGRLNVFWIETRTQSENQINSGNSLFIGYRHTQSLKFCTLRVDGTWTAPQEIKLPRGLKDSGGMAGVVNDYFELWVDGDGKLIRPKKEWARLHLARYSDSPVDDYTVSGPNWDTPYVKVHDGLVRVVMRNFRLVADLGLFQRIAVKIADVSPVLGLKAPKPQQFLLSTTNDGNATSLYYGSPIHWYGTYDAFANLVLEDDRITSFDIEYGGANDAKVRANLHPAKNKLAELSGVTSMMAISGSYEDVLLQASQDLVLVKRQKGAKRYRVERLGTTLATTIARKLFVHGVHGLLDLDTQKALKEGDPPLTKMAKMQDATNTGTLDFTGPYGVYYRELFFHIPFLIADHLNSQGRFAEARDWYQYIFDPTADGSGVDRVWRYLEFRNQTWPTMRKILTDKAAIDAYERDPFNPFAIARLRLSAFAKCIVMKYVDNLLDWGDKLFTQFTMESVNEATMLYAMASDILGPRPYEAADCGQSTDAMTYAQIEKTIGKGSSFLVELESHAAGTKRKEKGTSVAPAKYAVDPEVVSEARASVPFAPPAAPKQDVGVGRAWENTGQAGWATPAKAGASTVSPLADMPAAQATVAGSIGWAMIRQIGPAFCVPPNEDLLAYWDRVEDRLYKIHNCLDIRGRRRDLALFAPPIDPRLLVQMKAAGLSLDDVTNATSGDLPPYRFTYLIEKAKSYASTLQGFGNALLGALEKKDAEELARMRAVHEQNIAEMTTQLKQWDIDAAQEAIDSATKQKEIADFKQQYYADLVDGDLSAWELTEEISRHSATIFFDGKAALDVLYATFGIIMQIGSPFSLKFGGVELKSLVEGFGKLAETNATTSNSLATSAGLEASFDRRAAEWTFQRDMAQKESEAADLQIKAANIRMEIAKKSLAIHQKCVAQVEEVHAFYTNKFTSFGLYTWLSATLQRTYRQAYANTLAVARLAQAAYQYERDDDASVKLGAGSWDGAHAGLLAGDQLMFELQQLERRFIETNYRKLEVEQSFALAQVDPAALLTLQQTGACTIDIPELFFDLAYPGHYRRRIRAARLTIPCVTGPYTNVGATLTLTASKVRHTSDPGDAALKPVPLKRTVSIATSRAQSDPGVFEFSFRDERYMPFEGAGAVSTWKLELPKSFRPFDYGTISDVILTIAYDALANTELRTTVETQNANLEGALLRALSNTPLTRIFSLRQEFPTAFQALLASPPGTAVPFEIKDWHFPAFATGQGRTLKVTQAQLGLEGPASLQSQGTTVVLDGQQIAAPSVNGAPTSSNITSFVHSPIGQHSLTITALGGALRQADVVDVLISVRYTVSG